MASWLKKNSGELRFKAHNIKVLPDRGKRKIKSVIVQTYVFDHEKGDFEETATVWIKIIESGWKIIHF